MTPCQIEVLKALAHPVRLSIVEALSKRPRKLEELAVDYKITAGALTKHLIKLEKARLIKRAPFGRKMRLILKPVVLRQWAAWFKKHEKAWKVYALLLDKPHTTQQRSFTS